MLPINRSQKAFAVGACAGDFNTSISQLSTSSSKPTVAPEGGRLVVNAVEAERVRNLFALCACSSSMTEALGEARARGWTAKQWTSRNGKTHGGQLLGMSTLRLLVTNVLYCGDITHKGLVRCAQCGALLTTSFTGRQGQRLLY